MRILPILLEGHAVEREVTLNGSYGLTSTSAKPEVTPAVIKPTTLSTNKLVLREWSVSYAYSSFYVEEIEDLDVAAEALVRSRVATSVYVADGAVYWLKGDELRKEDADLRWREHETHAHFRLPRDVDGWAAHGLARALLHRFSEKKVLSPLPGPQHAYLRAAMEPSLLGFGDEHLVICPTLKLYKTGVFILSYEVMTPQEGIGVPELVEKYVNLFARWCDEAWVPAAIARIGVTTQLHRGGDDRADRAANLGLVQLMRAVADEMTETIQIEDFEFSLYPAHQPLDEILTKFLFDEEKDVELPAAARSITLGSEPEHGAPTKVPADNNTAPSDGDGSEDAAVADRDAEGAGDAEDAAQSYMLSDMFDNAEYAIRAALDPPREGKFYLRNGLRPRLTLGNYWQCRPQVSITKFDDQPVTASEIREQFADELGSIMVRVPNAPAKLARARLGDSLRPFEDHSLHINSAISLCIYASNDAGASETHVTPSILRPLERACTFEMIDYLAMRCHQLDQRATLATSVAQARAVRTDLGALENLTRTAFRAGELNEAMMAACGQLRLSSQVQEAREKASLAAEAATERSGDRSARFNVALTVVFGIVGAAGLTDSFAKPLLAKIGVPLPDGLEGPVCFGISAALVGLILWLVARLLQKKQV